MHSLPLGDTLALYIDNTDLKRMGLEPTAHDLAALARRALAERGAPSDAGLTLEVYPGGGAGGELLLFCSPLARATVAFSSLAAAIDAAKHLTPPPAALGSVSGCGTQSACADESACRSDRCPSSASLAPPPAALGSVPGCGAQSACADDAACRSDRCPSSASLAPPPAALGSVPGCAPYTALHLTDDGDWLLELRHTPRALALLSARAAEFGARRPLTAAYLAEHAKLLIAQNAVETLAGL